MTESLCILGRQPALGLAELESLFGADQLRPVGEQAVVIKLDPPTIDFSRLGGSVKFCKVLTILDTVSWKDIQKFLVASVPKHAKMLPEGKLTIGLSAYGLAVTPQQLNATGLTLKKVLRSDRPVRIVPNSETFLNSAQVLHNKLTHQFGWEFVLVRDGQKTILAQNIAEQDIEAYAARDQARPKRDARVGMLPPKLAQIIVNLAVGQAEAIDPTCGPWQKKDKTVLDPFCGTGVILQEATLMGYDVYGTDSDLRMVDYSIENVINWLRAPRDDIKNEVTIEVADATTANWDKPFNLIASETYLGRPFSTLPAPNVLRQVMNDVNTIHKKFLKNLVDQTKPGFRLCLAVPAWHKAGARSIRADAMQGKAEQRSETYMKYGERAAQGLTQQRAASASSATSYAGRQAGAADGFWHLPVLDHLTDMGYTRWSFVHASNEDLIYHREDQVVARELVVLTRK